MITAKICPVCGISFQCSTIEADNTCWCTALPNVVPMPETGDCLCPVCLKAKIKEIQDSAKTESKSGHKN